VDIPAWIPITVAAAVFQVWRTALQARLHERVRTGEALALVVVAFGVVMIAASEMV